MQIPVSSDLFIGLMSGTSLDGVDAVLADFAGERPRVMRAAHIPYDNVLRADLLTLNSSGSDEINRAGLLANRLSDCYAAAVKEVLRKPAVSPARIAAIGCHGQTIRHRPDLGYTVQLANHARLAETTGISVVGDFRSRDIAAGGQGAPLVPAFHRAMFARADTHVVVANIGGIANLTSLAPGMPIAGFDCGPGNLLMDAWIFNSRGERFDRDGAWAMSGKAIPALVESLLGEAFFLCAPPKSTGRDLFNLKWLLAHLHTNYPPADVQRSLLELTAESCSRAIERYCSGAEEIVLCGGGSRNTALRARLQERLDPRVIMLSDETGIVAEHVEALAFAWLARQTLRNQPGNLPDATGARGLRVLGAVYPA